MSTTSGLSVWWSTPASPDRFFTPEELERSDRYHRPIRMMAVGALGARVALLLGACWLAGGPLQRLAWSNSTSEMGLVGWLTSGRVLAGAALTTGALRAPAIAVDAWFEYRFRHGEQALSGVVAEDGHQTGGRFVAAPIAWFSATVAAITAGFWVVLVLLGGVGYWSMAQGGNWALRLSIVVLAMIIAGAAMERPFRQSVSKREWPLDDDQGESCRPGLDRLAASFGLAGVGLYKTETGTPSVATKRPGAEVVGDRVANACAVGLGPNRRVVVTEALLREPRPVRDFVLAHEFTHLARRHVLVQSMVTVAVYLSASQLLGVLAESGRPWSWFELETTDPLGMPVVVLVLLGLAGAVAPLVAWLTRAQERVADVGAISVLGPLPAELALKLHGQTAADLDPPWWVRLYHQHPTPAERLEFLARHQ